MINHHNHNDDTYENHNDNGNGNDHGHENYDDDNENDHEEDNKNDNGHDNDNENKAKKNHVSAGNMMTGLAKRTSVPSLQATNREGLLRRQVVLSLGNRMKRLAKATGGAQ